MRIAVPFFEGQVFGHFGRTKKFAIFEVEDKRVVSSHLLPAGEASCTELAHLLKMQGVNVVICGGISAIESEALFNEGIEFVANVQGNVRHAVEEYILDTLRDNPVKYSGHYEYERG